MMAGARAKRQTDGVVVRHNTSHRIHGDAKSVQRMLMCVSMCRGRRLMESETNHATHDKILT